MESGALLTTEDVANFLKVDVVTVRRLVSRGELAAYRVGGEFRFTENDLQDYLKRQYLPAKSGDPAAYAPHFAARYAGEQWFAMLRRFGPRPPRGAAKAGERFTERARRVLALTQVEAEQAQAAEIVPAHLLLGLSAEAGGGAARALAECGLSTDALRAAFKQHPGLAGAPRGAPDAPLTLAEGVKRALEAAVEHAQGLRHDHVGTEHLLLGLLADPANGIGGLLETVDVKPAALRKRALALLKTGPGDEAPVPPPA
jgi:excisionase family DNA binding protein